MQRFKYVKIELDAVGYVPLGEVINQGDYMALLSCPCGCREIIKLNLLPDAKPMWTVEDVDGFATIKPSVQRTVGCMTHFNIDKGFVTIH